MHLHSVIIMFILYIFSSKIITDISVRVWQFYTITIAACVIGSLQFSCTNGSINYSVLSARHV